ncbi:hypothetical protein ACIPRD_00115 [Streptomyces sp. NPDC090108]|uniref:hypothetical protein n=1 Tax=Streptomyces sp. NPDC090108 TaxID=3365947 RepID=UPI0037F995F9
MAWDEWEQLKAQAAERPSTHTRLNQLAPDGGGGGTGDLVVHQNDLGAVGHEARLLYDDIRGQADIGAAGADGSGTGSTARAASALKSHGFQLGGALDTTVEIWTSQVKSVLQACAHISDHLDYTKKLHAEDDARIGTVLRGADGSTVSVSQLDEYFK